MTAWATLAAVVLALAGARPAFAQGDAKGAPDLAALEAEAEATWNRIHATASRLQPGTAEYDTMAAYALSSCRSQAASVGAALRTARRVQALARLAAEPSLERAAALQAEELAEVGRRLQNMTRRLPINVKDEPLKALVDDACTASERLAQRAAEAVRALLPPGAGAR